MPAGNQPAQAPIIIIKKKGGHGGHHGGAWKVAYADFVTAMMALFIVLWLLNSSKQVQEAVGGYFRDPKGHGKLVGTNLAGVGDSLTLKKEELSKLKEHLEAAMKKSPDFEKIKDQVQITVTGEGMRIELMESEKGAFFQSGAAAPTSIGQELIAALGSEISKLTNPVLIEGHTDAQPFATEEGYTNWELSADRANAARRIFTGAGVPAGQIKQIRGFADQSLRKAESPLDPSNRRISILVQYENATAEPSKAEDTKSGDSKHDEHGKHADDKHEESKSHDAEQNHESSPGKQAENKQPKETGHDEKKHESKSHTPKHSDGEHKAKSEGKSSGPDSHSTSKGNSHGKH
jgi:chemotaxis protein MotB